MSAPHDELRQGHWAMSMDWNDLLFLHWPIGAEALRPSIPAPLELETFDGKAWLGVVPFRMARVRARCTPPLPWISTFPELNLRTYVRHGGHSGVFFYSLDAHQKLAVRVARASFGLPYFDARMSCRSVDGGIEYECERTHRGTPPASFRARYAPRGAASAAEPGSLEHFLVERYSLFVVDRRGRARRGDIWHEPWPLQPANFEIEQCDMTRLAGVELPQQAPHARFATGLRVRAWMPRISSEFASSTSRSD
ncbi:MAG: DUF2071 domain-containing protein [Planctomycetes bacterium]|nr:DUF2071 domain-containing protein [Planctomycetota bacterium]